MITVPPVVAVAELLPPPDDAPLELVAPPACAAAELGAALTLDGTPRSKPPALARR